MLERARSSDVHKIGDLFAFKVNSNNILVDSVAYVLVKINDEDVPDPKIELFPIRVQYKIYFKAELPNGLKICHIAISDVRLPLAILFHTEISEIVKSLVKLDKPVPK